MELTEIQGLIYDIEQIALSINSGDYFLAVQTCDNGLDYTFYDPFFSLIDGGQIDMEVVSKQSVSKVVFDLLTDAGLGDALLLQIDYDWLMEQC